MKRSLKRKTRVKPLLQSRIVLLQICLCPPLDKYCAVEHACWKAGQSAPYLHLAWTFDLVEKEKGKIKTTGILCNMSRSLLVLSPEDMLPAVYLCTNRIAPEHECKELNIGSGTVTAALEEACGTSRSRLRDMYNDLGDLDMQTDSIIASFSSPTLY